MIRNVAIHIEKHQKNVSKLILVATGISVVSGGYTVIAFEPTKFMENLSKYFGMLDTNNILHLFFDHCNVELNLCGL
jgi:hypothetical protein